MGAVSSSSVRNSETFPSQTELTVAKALLLLCSKPPQIIKTITPPPLSSSPITVEDRLVQNHKEEDLSPPSESRSCSSTLTSDSHSNLEDRLRFLAAASCPRELKLKSSYTDKRSTRSRKEDSSPTESIDCSSTVTSSEVSSSKVIRRKRSKYYFRTSNRRESHSGMSRTRPFIATPGYRFIEDQPETSSMSNASNASSPSAAVHGDEVSRSSVFVYGGAVDRPAPAVVRGCEVSRSAAVRSGESKKSTGKKKVGGRAGGSGTSGEQKRRKLVPSAPYLLRRAEDIMQVLSTGCASEVRIREVVGNSPDTSKALRMLLQMEKVKRFGAGGHRDPYIYMVVDSDVESD